MSYAPILGGTGLTAWAVLNRTMDVQRKTFDASAEIARDTDYFEAKIGEINTAEELVGDRRLLRVALGAFGLQDDINNKAFIRKILEGGVIDPKSLANKLSDSRYRDFSKAFGFELGTPNSKLSDFAPKIVEKFRRQSFEVAVGEQDDSLRLALNAQRSLDEIAGANSTNTTKWLKIMGNAPLRKVFETALGLPSSFGQWDLDQQLEEFKDRADRQLGSADISQFTEPEAVEKLVQRYLMRTQIAEIQTASSGSIAVSMMQGVVDYARTLRG